MQKQKKSKIEKVKKTHEDEQSQIVANRYSVSKKLGSGSYGTVFLVSDLKTFETEYVILHYIIIIYNLLSSYLIS